MTSQTFDGCLENTTGLSIATLVRHLKHLRDVYTPKYRHSTLADEANHVPEAIHVYAET